MMQLLMQQHTITVLTQEFTLRFQAWYETQLSYININLNNFTIRCFLVINLLKTFFITY